jgi:site-specific recombinase XerD
LKRLCEGRKQGWVLVSKRSIPGHLTTITGEFRKARRKAGLPAELKIYCARHDFGSRVFPQTKDLKLVMDIMGHKDVKTALKYQHPEHQLARAALN